MIKILNKSHYIWKIWSVLDYNYFSIGFYKYSDNRTSEKLILDLFFSWTSKYFFSVKKHISWDGLFWRKALSSYSMSSRNLAIWRMNVWVCNFQGNIIERYWRGLYMTWPQWKSCHDLKRGNDFLCCSQSYRNWHLKCMASIKQCREMLGSPFFLNLHHWQRIWL